MDNTINQATPYIECENCGAHLDHGEICDCRNKKTDNEAPEPTLSPEQLEAVTNVIKKVVNDCNKIIAAFVKTMDKVVRGIVSWIRRVSGQFRDCIMLNYCNNPRWWHYYKHSKKFRVRKKYFNMIRDTCMNELRKEVLQCVS